MMRNVTNSTSININLYFLTLTSTVVTTAVPAVISTVVSPTVVPTSVSTVVTTMISTPVAPTMVPTMAPTMVPTMAPTVVPPVVTVGTIIPIFWTSSGSDVYKYIVMWERDTSRKCPDVDIGNDTIPGGYTFYIIKNVEEDSRYFILVKAISDAGSAVSLKVTGVTSRAGE